MTETVRPAARRPWTRAAGLGLAALLGASIVGCASTPPAVVLPPGTAEQRPAPARLPDVGSDGVPNVNVTGGIMFQLLAAESALQQGDASTAYATYLGIARSTRDPRLARRAVEIALGARASPQALQAARMWAELAPQDAEADQTLGALLVAGGEYAEATPIFARRIRAAANPAEELARLQPVLARAPERQRALEMLDELAKPHRDDAKVGADVRLTLARAAAGAGDSARAEREARAALELQPGHERAALLLTQLLAQPDNDGRIEPANRAKAMELLGPFVERNPQARAAREAYARLLVGDGQYEAARAQFLQLVQGDPKDADALYALALLTLDDRKRRAEARELLERYLALIGDGGGMRKALLLGKLKRVDEGRKLLTSTPTDSAAERVQLTLAEGQLLREAGRHKEAFAFLTDALARNPDDSGLLYDAAMAAEKLDRIDVMERHLRRLIELKPDDAHAHNALGYSLADRNQRLAEAYELIARALKLAPTDGYIMDSMGWVYFRIARGIWRESRAIEPDNETLRSTLRRLKVNLQ